MLLSNLNSTVEDLNGELGRVVQVTSEVQEMVEHLEGGIQSVESALKSPTARYGGMAAGFLATSLLVKSRSKRSQKKRKKKS
jgi:hypothetical protein